MADQKTGLIHEYLQKVKKANKKNKKMEAKYLEDNPPQKELSATRLGKLRLEIKKHLFAEMKEIDKLVKKGGGEFKYPNGKKNTFSIDFNLMYGK